MSSPLEQGLAAVDWRETEIRQGNDALLRYQAGFGDMLNQEVRPEDIVIGGLSVKAAIDPEPPTYRVNPPFDATVDLEHWASTEEYVVRVARRFNGAVQRREAALLARQVTDKYDWVPGLAKRRLKAVTKMAGRSTTYHIAVFDADAAVPDDEALRTMRAQAQGKDRSGNLRHGLVLGSFRSSMPVDRRQVSDRVAYGIDELLRFGQDAATPELIRQAGQRVVDERLEGLTQDRLVCSLAMGALLHGRRLSSQPQHDFAL